MNSCFRTLLIILTVCWFAGGSHALAASPQLKPILKAIDPSQAKTDSTSSTSIAPPAPSPNPLGSITGAPVSLPPQQSMPSQGIPGWSTNSQPSSGYGLPASDSEQPEPGYGQSSSGSEQPSSASGQSSSGYGQPPSGYGQPSSGYGQPSSGYGQPSSGYGQPSSGYGQPPSGYGQPSSGYGQPSSGYGQPSSGYGQPSSGYGQPSSSYGQSSSGSGQPSSSYDQSSPENGQSSSGSGQPPPASGYPLLPPFGYPSAQMPVYQSAPAYIQQMPPAPRQSSFPSEDMIPEFGKDLPSAKPAAPVYSAPPAPAYPAPGYVPSSPDERRVMRLEQIAFGSTYPEHEVADRVDHLEKEVFGQPGSGNISPRLSRLEAKLGGQGAFGQPPPAPPAVAALPMQSALMNQSPATSHDDKTLPPARKMSGQFEKARSPIPAPKAEKPPEYFYPPGSDLQTMVKSLPFDPQSGDYFAQIPRFQETAAHWYKLPITIRIPANTPLSWQTNLQTAIKKWNSYLPLEVVSAHQSADIEVNWVNHLEQGQLGATKIEIRKGQMQSDISLLRPTFYPLTIPERALQRLFLHELGHALGIFGHSMKAGDLMQPLEMCLSPQNLSKPNVVSSRDINTLKKIYGNQPLPTTFDLVTPLELK